jgi:hypothetical protein
MQGFLVLNCIIGGQTLAGVSDRLNDAVGIVIISIVSLLVSYHQTNSLALKVVCIGDNFWIQGYTLVRSCSSFGIDNTDTHLSSGMKVWGGSPMLLLSL